MGWLELLILNTSALSKQAFLPPKSFAFVREMSEQRSQDSNPNLRLLKLQGTQVFTQVKSKNDTAPPQTDLSDNQMLPDF